MFHPGDRRCEVKGVIDKYNYSRATGCADLWDTLCSLSLNEGNNKYQRGKYNLSLSSKCALPSSKPERDPSRETHLPTSTSPVSSTRPWKVFVGPFLAL